MINERAKGRNKTLSASLSPLPPREAGEGGESSTEERRRADGGMKGGSPETIAVGVDGLVSHRVVAVNLRRVGRKVNPPAKRNGQHQLKYFYI